MVLCEPFVIALDLLLSNPSVSGNAGQNCIGIERILVHQDQHDVLYQEMVKRTAKLRLGCAMALPGEMSIPMYDVGAMISRARFEDIERVINEAINGGAVMEQGGAAYPHPYLEAGAFFGPTVVGRADPDSELMQQESESLKLFCGRRTILKRISVFAPIAALTPYSTVDEAVAIANGTRYGLGASVFGPEQEECIKLAQRLECGMVCINDMGTCYVRSYSHSCSIFCSRLQLS